MTILLSFIGEKQKKLKKVKKFDKKIKIFNIFTCATKKKVLPLSLSFFKTCSLKF